MSSVLPGWEPAPWDAGSEEAEFQQAGYDLRRQWTIEWTAIRWPDFPAAMFGMPSEWFKANDVWLVAQHRGEDLVLSELIWSGWPDPPPYGLASRPTGRCGLPWSPWGFFDALPDTWTIPEKIERNAED